LSGHLLFHNTLIIDMEQLQMCNIIVVDILQYYHNGEPFAVVTSLDTDPYFQFQ